MLLGDMTRREFDAICEHKRKGELILLEEAALDVLVR
jgi:hypothetical protein